MPGVVKRMVRGAPDRRRQCQGRASSCLYVGGVLCRSGPWRPMLILLGSNKLPFPTHSFAHRIPTGQRITRRFKGSFDATSPVVIRKRVRSIRVRFIHVVLDRRLFGRHSGGLVLSLYRGSRFGLSRPAGPQKPNGFQRMPWSCTPKFTRVSETRCPMKLRTAGRCAPCGSGYAIWIAKISCGANFVDRSK
jgi:hypothetical protein